MPDSASSSRSRLDDDQTLSDLLEAIVERLQSGESMDVEQWILEHPEHESRLRGLWPTIQAMSRLAGVEGRADGSAAEVQGGAGQEHRLGEFRIVREIGRGGMGVVYEAEQESLGRRVALKVLPFAAVLDSRQLARFKNEAHAAALLQHQSIVPVYSVGCERGVHYYAMQYVEGRSLVELIAQLRELRRDASGRQRPVTPPPAEVESPSPGSSPAASGWLEAERSDAPADARWGIAALCRQPPARWGIAALCRQPPGRQPPSPAAHAPLSIQEISTTEQLESVAFCRSVARLGVEAAEALDHAHLNGIVHRDIKPGNLLLDGRGHLWITDFGLARIGSDAGLTHTGDVLGTLRYMSPEQALARRVVVDHRTDIYSLGITLYELLTLEPVYSGRDRQELLRQIAQDEPVTPSRRNPRIPRDLETIVLKAMAKEPDERYETARQMADDLQRFLEDKTIAARRPSLRQRLARQSRRHRSVLTAIAATLLVAAMIGGAMIWRAYSVAVAQRRRAEAQERTAVREKVRASINLQLALQAVDDMYSGIAAEWITSDTSLSRTQADFLRKALAVYEGIASEPTQPAQPGAETASAYLKIARIHERLDQPEQQRDAAKRAVEGYRQLVQQHQQPQDELELAESRHQLSRALVSLGWYEESLDAIQQARPGLQSWATKQPDEPAFQEALALHDLDRAGVLCRLGRMDQAAEAVHDAQVWLQSVMTGVPTVDRPTHLQVASYQAARLSAEILRHQRRFDEGLKLCEQARDRCSFNRMESYLLDNRDLAHCEVALTCELAELYDAAGQLPLAAEQFRKALLLQQQTFKSRLKPIQYDLRLFFFGKFRDDQYHEAQPFCDYIETQIRLSSVLRRLGRPHEAELLLSEAERMSLMGWKGRGTLRYGAAWANSRAELSLLLQPFRPQEAERAARAAADVWQDVLSSHAHAQRFCSGVHGLQRDVEWFRETFSQQDLAVNQGADFNAPVFYSHGEGVWYLEAEEYDTAIGRFLESTEVRTEGHAFDWLYLAWAHWKLDQKDKAREWFDKADQWIQQQPTRDVELDELRSQVAQIMSE